MSIKDWNTDDRPIEKFIEKGKNSLSVSELLAILIGSGNFSESAIDLSKRILSDANQSLETLGKLTIAELMNYKGIGAVKAVKIAAALELGNRRMAELPEKTNKITSSKDAFQVLMPYFSGLRLEEFYVLYLNNAHRILKIIQLSIGNTQSSMVDIKTLVKHAVNLQSTRIIMAHNHPSGQLIPSDADKKLTRRVKEALELFDIALLDHLIIYEQQYLSFEDENVW